MNSHRFMLIVDVEPESGCSAAGMCSMAVSNFSDVGAQTICFTGAENINGDGALFTLTVSVPAVSPSMAVDVCRHTIDRIGGSLSSIRSLPDEEELRDVSTKPLA
jgi:hypothetical protein